MTEAPRRVLVRAPNWIGDIVMATPALRALRKHWPEARLTVAGPPACEALLAGLPSVDCVMALPSRKAAGFGGMRASAARLKKEGFDVALLLTNSWSSALVLAMAAIPVRVGYAGGGRTFLLTHAVRARRETGRHRMPVPMVEAYARLHERLGVPRAGHRFELVVQPRDEENAAAWLERHQLSGPLVGVHAGSSFGPSKLWYPEKFAAVIDALHEKRGMRAILFCGPGEQPLVRAIAKACRSPVGSAAEDPIDLGTLKAVVKRLTLLVTTDTGPRHFGPAFDVPTVCLMGSTDPRFTNTNLHGSLVVRTEVECSPCQEKECPLVEPLHHRCMRELTPAMVLAACERVLA